jgi:hypothetical protein
VSDGQWVTRGGGNRGPPARRSDAERAYGAPVQGEHFELTKEVLYDPQGRVRATREHLIRRRAMGQPTYYRAPVHAGPGALASLWALIVFCLKAAVALAAMVAGFVLGVGVALAAGIDDTPAHAGAGLAGAGVAFITSILLMRRK